MDVAYARSRGAHVAFTTFGAGPLDLLWISTLTVSFESFEEEPHTARYLRRLASFARVIRFDWRGVGLSDPPENSEPHTVGDMATDALAVLDAAGSTRVAILAETGAGVVALELAASEPDRVDSLVFANCYARLARDDDYRVGVRAELLEGFLRDNSDPDVAWTAAGQDDLSLIAPSLRNDTRFLEWWSRAGRRGASPIRARQLLAMTVGADQRGSLSSIGQPTLVLSRADDLFVPARLGKWMAEHIDGARYVELPGNDHLAFSGDADQLLDEVEEFLTGQRHGSADRVLATVLFTDIVDSTARAATLGDSGWRSELDAHDALVRAQLGRFGGREVNTTGDGFVATFTAPTDAIRCALAIAAASNAAGLPIRAGLHTGECERRGDDLAGLAVHIAARVAALAGAGEVWASRTVRDVVVGSAVTFASRGEFELRGVPLMWEVFAIEAG
ncbi:MAG: adenylate/guanylate cyclase domain-containing protein [Acidimicrobiia bacterium]